MAPDWRETTANGEQVVQEILRENCLWFTTKSTDVKISGESGEYSEAWWNYMEKVGAK